MKLSIIIAIYNEEENISRLLKSIFVNKVKKSEIIVVDDGSTDRSPQILKKFKNKINYIRIKKSGVARARNVGINKSKGSLIVFFDGDVILKKDTLSKFVKYFRENKKLNILQGIWEKNYPYKTNYITKHLLLKLNFNLKDKISKEKKYFKFKGIKVAELMTGCVAVRKKVLKDFRFNEDYKKAGGEEFELGSRLFSKYDIFYTSKIKVYHEFENIYETLKRIFFRTINYSIFNFNLNKDKKEIFNKFNETSVPKRDILNLFIVSFIALSLIAFILKPTLWFIPIIFFIAFYINNFRLLKYINKNLSFLSAIKSYLIELVIILVKTSSIIMSLILVYILRLKRLKI